jgi:hypothetical protein
MIKSLNIENTSCEEKRITQLREIKNEYELENEIIE